MFHAKGYYQKTWTNTAQKNLKVQAPKIAEGFPAIHDFYPATVNIQFEPKIIVCGWDHRTPPIHWDALGPEVFDLLHVRLSFEGIAGSARALWYVAHRSLHRNDPHKHEFLVEKWIDGLRPNMEITLECDRPAIELPYEEQVRDEGGLLKLARTIVVFQQ